MEPVETISLHLSTKQVQTLSLICETMARLYMGQTDVLNHVCDASWDDLQKVKAICFPELSKGAYKGINSNVPDEARQAWDIYQVLRHFLSWRNQPNTPDNRVWPEQFGVNYDTPTRLSHDCELPTIEVTKVETV